MFGEQKDNGRPFFIKDDASLVPAGRPLSPTAIIAGCAVSQPNGLTARNVTDLAIHEQLRAVLAKTALDNVSALSAVEAHLNSVAPLGEERYKTINDAFAVSAAMRIARW